jgi:hypothetical protein
MMDHKFVTWLSPEGEVVDETWEVAEVLVGIKQLPDFQ